MENRSLWRDSSGHEREQPTRRFRPLTKRQELLDETATLRERIAAIGNEIEAFDRVLDSFGYAGDLEGRTARQARIILFYRGDPREFLACQLAKAPAPRRCVTSAELVAKLAALGIHETERSITNKVSRGEFTAAFLLQCLVAIEVQQLQLS